MFSSPVLGTLMIAAVVYLGIVKEASNPWVFLNHHALILVLGGTIAVTVFTFPLKKLVEVYDFVIYGFYLKRINSQKEIIEDMVMSIKAHYKAEQRGEIANMHWEPTYPFLREGFRLLGASELNASHVESILRARKEGMRKKYSDDAKVLNAIAKYPPHLGLLGASSGMIEMMSGLGKTGITVIGASMAVALTATLWGIGLNNFVFLPLADNAQKALEDDMFLRDLVIDAVVAIKQNQPERVVLERCFSKLTVGQRAEIKEHFKTFYNEPVEKIKNAA